MDGHFAPYRWFRPRTGYTTGPVQQPTRPREPAILSNWTCV